jgi:hypothetical protein
MNMNRLALTMLLLVIATQANATAYKCIGAGGKVEYRDVPCLSSQKVEKTFSQDLGSSQPVAAGITDPSPTPAGAAPADGKASQSAPRAVPGAQPHETDSRLSANSVASGATIADSRADYAAGGLCSGSISWDNCRKLGLDSIVDCKRLDEDTVFRASVLQSKGIQCRTRPEHPVRTK